METNDQKKDYYGQLAKMSIEDRKKHFNELNKRRDEFMNIQAQEISNAYDLFGANELMTNYGNQGKNVGTYSLIHALAGENAQKAKMSLLEKKIQKNNQLGISLMPTVNDDELNTHMMELAYQGFQMMELDRLEDLIKKADTSIDYSVLDIANKVKEVEIRKEEYEIENAKEYTLSEEEGRILQQGMIHKQQLLEDFKMSSATKQLAYHSEQRRKNYIESLKEQYGKPEKREEAKPSETKKK